MSVYLTEIKMTELAIIAPSLLSLSISIERVERKLRAKLVISALCQVGEAYGWMRLLVATPGSSTRGLI